MAPNESGILKSSIFPGLWLDGAALLRGDLAGVLAVLQQGTASPEHASFIAALQKRGKRNRDFLGPDGLLG